MFSALRKLFKLIVFLAVVAIIGRIFFFDVAETNSHSMIPNLVPGDIFLVYRRGVLGPGDIAVCKNPENPDSLIVLRIFGVPGSTISIRSDIPYINGKQKDHMLSEGIIYEDNNSGEHLEYYVAIAHEYVGGKTFTIALMDRAGNRNFKEHEVEDGFFLLGDNRNRARDSRHFGEIRVEDCIGRAMVIAWPGEDCGDLKRKDRILEWLD
ncbi:MAG: signal peptidase I [Proteobacteria bacterium]|nr:signal peptidase I [Pseudomonadota bacterium]